MAQPPYPPPGAGEPGGGQPGSGGWWSGGPDEPTEKLRPPGEPLRHPTRQLPPPGQHAQYGPPGQYGAPGQYPPPGQPWGPPGPPGRGPRSSNSTLIALLVAVVVILAAVAVALYLVFGRGARGAVTGSSEQTTASSVRTTTPTTEQAPGVALPDPTGPPDGLGDDPVLDVLAQGCYLGDMQSCDDLFDESDAGSDYETYGDTCAGRQPTGTLVLCTETFPQD
jgi:hypothetical protein